jgi:hypothetical protein
LDFAVRHQQRLAKISLDAEKVSRNVEKVLARFKCSHGISPTNL